jgi:hypothetical protein
MGVRFALEIGVLCRQLPHTFERQARERPVVSSWHRAVGANDHAACRGIHTSFIATLGIAVEERDETDYRMEFIVRFRLLKNEQAFLWRVDNFRQSLQRAQCDHLVNGTT